MKVLFIISLFIIYKLVNNELSKRALSDIAYFEQCEWQIEIDRTVNVLNFSKFVSFMLFVIASVSFLILWS